MISYVFNQESYSDLSSLAKAYIDNFDLGMDDIYTNTKELIKFIKSRISDKGKVKKYINILAETKYKSNALTFMIFEMTDHKEIIIAGVKMDLLTYLQALRENPDPANNILFAFLEDGGITKTFRASGADPKLCQHSRAIERNFRNPFTYKYLVAYYGYETKESLDGKVRSIAINGEECFRRFSNLARSEAFLISLAHKAGFTDVIDAVNDENPTFVSLKLLNKTKETEEDYLRRIVDGSFFFWMVDNFDKYDYKPKALRIYKRFVEIKKEYDGYKDQIAARKISSISFDNYIGIAKRLYENYLYFISAYKNDLISVKKKYDREKYDLNKPYARTYICQDYMQGKVVKLYTPHEGIEQKVNPLTGEVIEEVRSQDTLDDVSKDAPDLILPEDKKKEYDIKKQRKNLLGQYGFANVSIIMGLIMVIPMLVMVFVFKFLSNGSGKMATLANNFGILLNSYSLYIALGVVVILILASGLSMLFNKKSQYALKKYDTLVNNINPKDFYPEEKILYQQEKEALKKQSFKTFNFPAFFIQISLGVLIAFISLVIVAALSIFIPFLGSFSNKVGQIESTIVLSLGLLLGIIFGMLFQKKNSIMSILFAFVVLVLCTTLVIAM